MQMVEGGISERQVFQAMKSSRRAKKYLGMPTGVRLTSALLGGARGEFFKEYYVLMRHLDDIADHDIACPDRFADPVHLLEAKIQFAKHPRNPQDYIDRQILYCFQKGLEFGQDFTQETIDILTSLLFDARRFDSHMVFPAEELDHHFELLDITGTISASLKAFGEYPNPKSLMPLGRAIRIYYNIRDFDEDIEDGYVNIPAQEMDQFHLTLDHLDSSQPKVQRWFKAQAEEARRLFRQYFDNMDQVDYGWKTKAALFLGYEQSLFRKLPKVIAGKGI